MTAIRISNLTKDFGARRAVDDLTLSIADGELFALLGPNGAGKTVTIKMLCCLLAPTSGDAVLLGDSIRTDPAAVKQKINLSPQETAVAPKLSVAENLELIAVYRAVPKGRGPQPYGGTAGAAAPDRPGDREGEVPLRRPAAAAEPGYGTDHPAADRLPGRADARSRRTRPPGPVAGP